MVARYKQENKATSFTRDNQKAWLSCKKTKDDPLAGCLLELDE